MFWKRLLLQSPLLLRSVSQIRMSAKPKVVFVLGGPGAGKGTQCENIVANFGYVHLSAGDLLREERNRKDSKVGAMIEDYIKKGEIVPVEVTCGLLETAMQKSGKEKFLIDGFPRNKNNLDGWVGSMGDKTELQFVLFFDCDEKICVERCLKRGAAGSGRSDDNKQSLEKRIHTYNVSTMPIIQHYEALDLVKKVDASKSVDEVFSKVKEIFEKV